MFLQFFGDYRYFSLLHSVLVRYGVVFTFGFGMERGMLRCVHYIDTVTWYRVQANRVRVTPKRPPEGGEWKRDHQAHEGPSGIAFGESTGTCRLLPLFSGASTAGMGAADAVDGLVGRRQ